MSDDEEFPGYDWLMQDYERDAERGTFGPTAVPDAATGRYLVKWHGVTCSLTREEWEEAFAAARVSDDVERDEFGIPTGEHTLVCGCRMKGRGLLEVCAEHWPLLGSVGDISIANAPESDMPDDPENRR